MELGVKIPLPRHDLKCDYCGKFMSYNNSHIDFTPESPFGPEEITRICANCKSPRNDNHTA